VKPCAEISGKDYFARKSEETADQYRNADRKSGTGYPAMRHAKSFRFLLVRMVREIQNSLSLTPAGA
jgi:hypothetical protein